MALNQKQREVKNRFRDQIDEIDHRMNEKSDEIEDSFADERAKGEREIEKAISAKLKDFKDDFFKKLKNAKGGYKKKLMQEHEKQLERIQKETDRERVRMQEALDQKLFDRKKRKADAACAELADLKRDLLAEQAQKLDEIEKEKSKVRAEFGIDDKEFEKELNAFNYMQKDPTD